MKRWAILLLLTSAMIGQSAKAVRVFLTDQQSWADSSNLVAAGSTAAPSRTEQIHTLAKYCPAVTVTAEPSKAAFIITWTSTSYAATRWGGHEHEWVVYNSQKDLVGTGSDYHMKNAAKDICKVLTASLPH